MEVSTGPVNVKNKVQTDVGSLCNPGKRCFIISEEEIHFSADLLKMLELFKILYGVTKDYRKKTNRKHMIR